MGERISSSFDRRAVLKGSMALAAAAGLGTSGRTAQAQSRTIYVNTWGGSWTAAEDAAFFTPFTKATGVAVKTVAPVSYAKLKAQVQSGSYEWDITATQLGHMLQAYKEGLIEPIDRSIVKPEELFPGAVVSEGCVAYCALGTNLVYRKDKFPNGGPRSWADFWDVKRFPGTRSLYSNALRTIPLGLLADGVPKDKLYPLDLDRAFRKLDEIKPHIKVWWTQGNQSQQLLRDGEVDMMSMWNARASELGRQGVPVELIWEGAAVTTTVWSVAKGAPNAKSAWEFVRFAVQAERQADFANRLFYGPYNPKAFDFIPPEIARELPTAPENMALAHVPDAQWEADHLAEMTERFTKWLAA